MPRIPGPAEPAPSLETLTAGKTAGEPGQVGAGFPCADMSYQRPELSDRRQVKAATGAEAELLPSSFRLGSWFGKKEEGALSDLI